MNANSRIGIGYDIHRLVPGRALIVGAVPIPHTVGALGHSDGDVVLHALCDAILGALGQPDIGELFPNSDPAWRNADSRQFVEEALRRARTASYEVGNIDVIIHAERPKLTPYKPQIRAALAQLLGIGPDCIGVKARTNEGLGEIGRGEAIASWVAVTLSPIR